MSLAPDNGISVQIANVIRSPIPFITALTLVGGIIWRLLKWRYDAIIDGLEHRLKLRQDTIDRYEAKSTGTTLGPNSSTTSPKPDMTNRRPVTKPVPPIERPSINVTGSITPGELRKIYDGRTALQADKLASQHLGKIIEVAGLVKSVYGYNNSTKIRVRLRDDISENAGFCGIWLEFSQDTQILEVLKEGDKLFATGKIDSFDQFDVNLIDCQVIKAE